MISRNAAETVKIGELIGSMLEPGDVVALIGELGAGKTCLTQGLARGLGVPAAFQITSPTFTLINEYPGRINLTHIDTYRLSGITDMIDLGCEEYFSDCNVVVIEWAEKVREILPESTVFIQMTYLDENDRKIEISGNRNRCEKIQNALREGGFE